MSFVHANQVKNIKCVVGGKLAVFYLLLYQIG